MTTINYTSTVVLPQGTYCWRVQSKDAAGNIGVESTPRSFSIFIGTAPVNNFGAVVPSGTANVTFTWAAVAGATGYNVQVATDTTFTIPAPGYPHPVGSAILTYTPTTALTPGTYYWRVLSNRDTTPANVGYRTLFVGTAPVVTLIAPANGSTQPTLSVNLEWNAVTPPLNVTLVDYEVQYATNATFTAGLQSALVATPPLIFPTPALNLGVTYYWRVRARYGDGTPAPGAFSVVRSFKVDNVAPPAPNLTAPANKAILAAVRPTLTWAAVAGATSYLLDVDDDPENDGICDFTLASMIREDVVVTAPAVSYMIPVPGLAQGSYCWRVQSKDAAGNVGSESTSRSFSIFIGTAPANGVFAPAGKPAFTWAAAVSPTLGYDLEVATDTAFTTFASGYPKHFGPAVLTYTVPAAALPLPLAPITGVCGRRMSQK